MNRADLLFKCGVFSATIMVSAIILGIAQRDMIALAWALVAAFHINFIQAYYLMYSRIFGKSMLNFFFRMVPAALTTTGMAVWAAF
ncbi:colanic acid exporter [compost metagenome]